MAHATLDGGNVRIELMQTELLHQVAVVAAVGERDSDAGARGHLHMG